MLLVDIKLRPYGDKSQPQRLHRIHITNLGTGTEELGNYVVTLKGREEVAAISGFPRSQGALALVYEAIGRLLDEAPVPTKEVG